MKKSLLELINKRKSQKIKKPVKKVPRWLFPSNAEKHFDKILRSLNRELKTIIKSIIYPEIPSLIIEVKSKTPTDRNDDFMSRLNSLLVFTRSAINGKLEQTIVQSFLIGQQIANFNKTQFQKINESVFGFDIFKDEPWLLDQLKIFSAQNSKKITEMVDDEIGRVAEKIEMGLQQGQRFTDTAKELQKTFGISDRKATFIARDQTQRLNASLTQLRQQDAGVSHFEWQTSGDERVRATHRANDGKIFSWSKPPPITGFVGHDYNCRCTAIPVFENLDY